MRGGLICRSRGSDISIVIPLSGGLRQEVMQMHHEALLAGHLGLYRMVGALSKHYYQKGMHGNCRKYCKQCLMCQASKVSTQQPQGLLQPLSVPQYPFEQVTMDLIAHLPRSNDGFNSILTMVDCKDLDTSSTDGYILSLIFGVVY